MVRKVRKSKSGSTEDEKSGVQREREREALPVPGMRREQGGNPHLQPDLLVDEDRAVAEGDGIAEAGLPLDGLVAEVHEDLGALGVRVEEQWRGWEPPARWSRSTVLLLVVASVRGDREGAPDGVYKGMSHNDECVAETPEATEGWVQAEVAHGPGHPPSLKRTRRHLLPPSLAIAPFATYHRVASIPIGPGPLPITSHPGLQATATHQYFWLSTLHHPPL